MEELAVVLFKKEGYALAALAEEIERVEKIKGVSFLSLKNVPERVRIDEIVDFLFIPLNELFPLPHYVKRMFKSATCFPGQSQVWGIIKVNEQLLPIVHLKGIGEGDENEAFQS